jgi:hypothetical protein
MESFSSLAFRSSARLALENYSGALEDAREALTFAPQYHEVSQNFILQSSVGKWHCRCKLLYAPLMLILNLSDLGNMLLSSFQNTF